MIEQIRELHALVDQRQRLIESLNNDVSRLREEATKYRKRARELKRQRDIAERNAEELRLKTHRLEIQNEFYFCRMAEAYKYMKEGKDKYFSETTNSQVDEWLRWFLTVQAAYSTQRMEFKP